MNSRGNSMLVTMIALAVLMVLVVGAIRFTGTNREAAIAKLKGDQVTACAETARRYLLSRLKLFSVPVSGVVLASTRLPDDPVTAKQSRIGFGHYDQTPVAAAAGKIAGISSGAVGACANNADDIVNTVKGNGSCGYFSVTMVCQEAAGGREAEVEFLFKYAL